MQRLFDGMWTVGLLGNAMLFLWLEWEAIGGDVVRVLSPFVQLHVVIALVAHPMFWALAALSGLGRAGARAVAASSDGTGS